MVYTAPHFPKRLELELVSDCNLRCTYCPRHYVNDLKGYMDFNLFSKIISEASAYPETVLVLHRRGESLLHKEFKRMLNEVAGKFKEIQLATNATLLTEEKFEAIVNALTFISFSLDAPEAYDRTRVPANYQSVEKKIMKFLDFNKGKVQTQASMVKTEVTPEENVEIFKKIWERKVDRVRIYEEHSKGGVFGAIGRPRENRRPCIMPIYEMLIYEDGNVGRCNHDWNGSPLGDLNRQTISMVWTSREYKELRAQHLRLEYTDLVCKMCDSWYPEIGKQGTGEVLEK